MGDVGCRSLVLFVGAIEGWDLKHRLSELRALLIACCNAPEPHYALILYDFPSVSVLLPCAASVIGVLW